MHQLIINLAVTLIATDAVLKFTASYATKA